MRFVSEDADWDQTEMFWHDWNENLFFFNELGGFGVAPTQVLLHKADFHWSTLRNVVHSRRASRTRTQKKTGKNAAEVFFRHSQGSRGSCWVNSRHRTRSRVMKRADNCLPVSKRLLRPHPMTPVATHVNRKTRVRRAI